MANKNDVRPVGEFTRLFAAEVKGALKSADVNQLEVAEALGRNQSYVSERISGKRAFTTDDLDVIAKLCGETPKTFITEMARRTREFAQTTISNVTPIRQNQSLEEINPEILENVADHTNYDSGEPDIP